MAFMFEKLKVYQKVVSLADAIARPTQEFPRRYWFLVDQLSRASLSTATNVAEGHGRLAKAYRSTSLALIAKTCQNLPQNLVHLRELAKKVQCL